MTDFFTKKQKKYWCDICRVFIEYNRITIEHHKNTSQHIHNMKRGTKYQKVKREYKSYVQDLRDQNDFTSENKFLGKKTILHEKKENTAMFNKIKMEMMQEEMKMEQKKKQNWQIFFDKKYRNVFFYNLNTGESQWEKPPDYKINDSEIKKIIEDNNKK